MFVATPEKNEKEEEDEDKEEEKEEEEKMCKWKTVEKKKLKKGMSGLQYTKTAAMEKCVANDDCAGISCKSDDKCMLNGVKKGKSDDRFTGYIKKC